jgi:hypothetical protein
VGYGARFLGVIVCLAAPSVARAQLAPIGVPAGVVRFEVDGALDSWDKRFRDGDQESYAADLSGPLDSDLLPILAPYDAIVQRVTGLDGVRLNLGALTTDAQADVGTAVLGLTLGVTRSIAVFGRLPLGRARVQTDLGLDAAGANAGLNPGTTAQDPFFAQFDAALSALEAQIAPSPTRPWPKATRSSATCSCCSAIPAPRHRSSPPAGAMPEPRSRHASPRSRRRSIPTSASADSPPGLRFRPRP